jgi:phosphate starvation-inducible PhoH-like protein
MSKKSRRISAHQQNYQSFGDDGFQPSTPFFQKKREVKPVEAKTEAQGNFMAHIMHSDIIMVYGPAGTGKTFISVAMAVDELKAGVVDKIIVTRPMQGVDEEMGFLPGTEEEKYAPWMMPVMDVLIDRLGEGEAKYLLKSKKVEFRPLMMMRGSSFKDSWIIMDEAQNTTPKQMKMFLTRIGKNCKMIINGDQKQSDLKSNRGMEITSGLEDAVFRLHGVPKISVCEFTKDDIVRHGLVRSIIEQYEG